MSITATTLSADLSATGLTAKVTSGTGFPAVGAMALNVGYPVLIGSEYMFAVEQPVAGVIRLRGRGSNGSAAVAHDILSDVMVSSVPGDFPAVSPGEDVDRPPQLPEVVHYGENGAIAVPIKDTIAYLSKATAAAMTLAAPSRASNGVRLTITSQTAAAHTVTATGLLGDGAAGSPEDLATWDAFIGASLKLVASDGIWNLEGAANGVVIT